MTTKRRRIPRGDKRHADLIADGLREMRDAGQGVWNIRVAFREEAMDLLVGALLGDADTILFASQLQAAMKGLRKQAPLCLLCDVFPALDRIAAIAICSAAGSEQTNAPLMSNALCDQCVERLGSKQAVLAAVKAKYLTSFDGWREIKISDQTGHA